MADRISVEDVIATGEAHTDSPKLVSIDGSFPASRHASLALPTNEEGKDGGGISESTASPIDVPGMTDVRGRQVSVASTGFSEAPTAITAGSDYTSNTGGRARYSWRGISSFWQAPGNLPPRRPSASNGPDDQDESSASVISSDEDLLMELPAGVVARPNETNSFFDSDSESEGETIIRTASRASSARTQPPRLIDHRPSNDSLSQTRSYRHVPTGSPGPSQKKAEQILGTKLSNLHELLPFDEKADAVYSASDKEQTSTANHAPPYQAAEASPKPAGSSFVMEMPNTPMRAEALDTLPSAFAGFGALRLDKRKSSQLTVSPLDALRSNPVTRLDTAGLRRSTSAPSIPKRLDRKVTIRPVDLDAIRSASEKKLFRDAVVSTPYPFRHHSIGLPTKHESPPSPTQRITTVLPTTNEGPTRSLRRASHGSPPEILVLELSLAKQRLASKMVIIAIYDRSTFDDYALFASIRENYHRSLLGPACRYLSARTLSDASLVFTSASFSGVRSPTNPTATASAFDAASFLKHFARPKCGRKRKTWLQWLRARQPRAGGIHANATPVTMATSTHPSCSGHHPCFSPDGIPQSPAFVDPRSPPPPPPSETDPDQGSPPEAASESRHVSFHSSSATTNPTVPKIILHHSFSIVRLAIAMIMLTLLTSAATTLWTILGYPGPRPTDKGNGAGQGISLIGGGGIDWQLAAQTRVTTGLLLGLLVFCLGAAQIGAWMLMSCARL